MKKYFQTTYKLKNTCLACAILGTTLLLPIAALGQSEITYRVSVAEAGLRGPVKHVQTHQTCDATARRCFKVVEEEFNADGWRTAIVSIDSLGRFYTRYDYTPDGRLHSVIEGFPLAWDSIAFSYDNHGCLTGYNVFGTNVDTTGGKKSTRFTIQCDKQCRPLFHIAEWGDSSEYRYDSKGRLVYKALPGAEMTYYYDAKGRLERIRTGAGRYVDQFFRYDKDDNLIESWHSDWEQDAGGEPNPSPHIRYTILKTDSHGNWTKAKTRVTESGKTYTCTIERVISYYE